jgi:hypothetical protein
MTDLNKAKDLTLQAAEVPSTDDNKTSTEEVVKDTSEDAKDKSAEVKTNA